MSDTTDAAVDEGLVERLTEDAIRCSGAEKCVVPLMYCVFGPADRCDEIAELWLHVIAERDELRAENEDLARQNLALTLQLAGSDMPPVETFVSTTTTPRG